MLRLVLRWSVAAVAVYSVAACAPSTAPAADPSASGTKPATTPPSPVPATGGAGYSAALSARLVDTESLPPGFSLDIATVMASDAGDRPSAGDASCSREMIPLLSARRLTGTPSATAAATLSYDAGPDDLWVGTEVLRTYPDDGARRAITDLRTYVDRCPTVALSGQGDDATHRFALTPGPKLGDDSVHLNCTATSGADVLKCDVLLIHVGTTLVVIQEEGNKPGNDELLTRVAEAALRRYQKTGS
ncbi:hypothetical protein [Micromonospora sp. NPDC093244]|uniref:hypothetical protein n=1 Tax=Micromonospora sp. NPDC093244 TaxID=3155071 RepID=UPI00341D83EE